jgi:7-cyano-7-deazaguanine synthase in queuosine biosynthesis
MAIVNQTLAQVKESMDSDTYAKFEEKAKEQTLDTVNAWRNEVLANVATVLMSAKKDESHLRMGIEEDSKTPTSLWDRM